MNYSNTNYNVPTMDYTYQDPTVVTTTTTYGGRRKNTFPLILLAALAAIIFVVLAFLLFGQKGNSPTGTSTTDSSKKINIQWWGVYLDKDVVQPVIDDYQAQNPNVTIEYANRWPSGDYKTAAGIYRSELNRLLKANQSAQIPDIFMVHNTWVGDYEAYVKPSTQYSADSFKSTFYPAVGEDFAKTGQVLGVPIWMDTLAIAYNKDILKTTSTPTPPQGWNEFKSLSNKLIIKNAQSGAVERAGFAAGTAENVSFSVELLYLLFAQNQVQFLNQSNLPAFSTNNYSVEALKFYKNFATSSSVDYSGWSSTFKNDSAEFLEQDVAMVAITSWRYRQLLYYNDYYNINLDIGISRIPQLQNQTEPIINWADYWGNMVALNRPNSDASWAFLKWITEPEQLKKLNVNEKNNNNYFGFLYPRRDMAQEFQDDTYLKTFNESLPYAKTWYQVKGMEVRDVFVELLKDSNISTSNVATAENEIQVLISSKGTLSSD